MDAIQEMTNAFGILLFINGIQKDIKEKIDNEPHIGNYIIVNFFLEILLFFILHTFIPCKSGWNKFEKIEEKIWNHDY